MKKFTVIALLFFTFIETKSFSQDSIRLVNPLSPAEYPDGQKVMFQFINNNLKIIKLDERCPNERIFVNFCVNIDGSLSEIKIVEDVCLTYDAEVKRVFSIMKKWKPAVEIGINKVVKSYYIIPVRLKFD